MDKVKKKKFFVLISFKKLTFLVLDENNYHLFKKEFIINEDSLEKIFYFLEQFLDQNIIHLEKKFKYYIEEINLIVDLNEFINVEISTINNFEYLPNQTNANSNYLINIKDDVMKCMHEYYLVHMVINKYIIDGIEHLSLPKDNTHKNVFLEVQFVLSKNEIIQKLKKIFSKYQIVIKNISCYNYVNCFKKSGTDNIFDLTDRLIDGFNQKEIIFVNKVKKNIGFFEKFFKFFK